MFLKSVISFFLRILLNYNNIFHTRGGQTFLSEGYVRLSVSSEGSASSNFPFLYKKTQVC